MDSTDDLGMNANELLSVLQAAAAKGDSGGDAMTTKQLSQLVGRSERWVLERLNILKDEGKLEVTFVHKPNVSGISSPRPAYRLLSQLPYRANDLTQEEQ